MTTLAKMKPTAVPSMSDETIRLYCSYMNTLIPYFLVNPMALRHPYSQIFSLMF